MSFYGLLADGVVAAHLAYVSFVVVGQFLIWLGWALGWGFARNRWFRSLHLLAIAIVVFEALINVDCPLTVWEYQLRTAAGQDVTGATFMGRLLHRLLFYDAPAYVFTIGYCLTGALILGTFLLFPPAFRFRKPTPLEVP
jgi:Protein of Unknown function (DUF2784)